MHLFGESVQADKLSYLGLVTVLVPLLKIKFQNLYLLNGFSFCILASQAKNLGATCKIFHSHSPHLD